MTDEPVQIQFKIHPIDPKAPGFLPMYRKLLSAKRVLGDTNNAQPEDVDQMCSLIEQHLDEPSNPAEKRRFLEMLSGEDVMRVIDEIMGTKTVSPPNGAA